MEKNNNALALTASQIYYQTKKVAKQFFSVANNDSSLAGRAENMGQAITMDDVFLYYLQWNALILLHTAQIMLINYYFSHLC